MYFLWFNILTSTTWVSLLNYCRNVMIISTCIIECLIIIDEVPRSFVINANSTIVEDLKTVQYFGVVITAPQLDKLVEKIPLSNPLYTLPSATIPPQVSKGKVESTNAQKAKIKQCLEMKMKFRDRLSSKKP